MLHFLVRYPRLLGFPLFVKQIIGDKQQCNNKLNFCYIVSGLHRLTTFCLLVPPFLSCLKLEISPHCHFPCKNFSAFVSISYETSSLGRPKWLRLVSEALFLFCSIASKLIARDKYIQKSLVHVREQVLTCSWFSYAIVVPLKSLLILRNTHNYRRSSKE